MTGGGFTIRNPNASHLGLRLVVQCGRRGRRSQPLVLGRVTTSVSTAALDFSRLKPKGGKRSSKREQIVNVFLRRKDT